MKVKSNCVSICKHFGGCVGPLQRVTIEVPQNHKFYTKVKNVYGTREGNKVTIDAIYCQRAIQEDSKNGFLVSVIEGELANEDN